MTDVDQKYIVSSLIDAMLTVHLGGFMKIIHLNSVDLMTSFEPRHAKTSLLAYADNEGPDQPAHPLSLIRTFAVRKSGHY